MEASERISTDELALRVYSMIRSYVSRKTEKRCGKSYANFKASGYKDGQYIEANNKVCMDAFLAIRGRKDHREFVNYFTATICSVPQFLGDEQYRQLSVALLDPEQWESQKSLSKLALSALSQASASVEKQGDEQ
jgi:CRISPR-associated protein Cmx8